MAGRPPTVDPIKSFFLGRLTAASSLAAKAIQLRGSPNPAVRGGLHPKQAREVVELAFMGMVASWEEFLEMTLVRYLAGAKTTKGFAPTLRVGQAKGLPHAYRILSRNPKFDPKKHYLKVTGPAWVTDSADFFFSVHGYGDLKIHASILEKATAIRNRVAHCSEKCKADFKDAAIFFLAPASGTLVKGYGPGDLLMEPVTRHFRPTRSGATHFEAYKDLFTAIATKIVP